MRDAVRRKLHSQAGASLLIALLFFLTALTVGAVVLTAAATNAGRIGRNRQEQQAYLAVSSAAQLVKEDFRGLIFTGAYDKKTTKTTVIVTTTNPETGETTTSYRTEYGGPEYEVNDATGLSGDGGLEAGELLKDSPAGDLKTLYLSTVPEDIDPHKNAPADMEYALEFTAEGEMPGVLGSLTVDKTDGARYTVTVKLYAEAEDGTRTNAMTLLFTPAVSKHEETVVTNSGNVETTTTTYTTTVTWSAPVVTKGAAE